MSTAVLWGRGGRVCEYVLVVGELLSSNMESCYLPRYFPNSAPPPLPCPLQLLSSFTVPGILSALKCLVGCPLVGGLRCRGSASHLPLRAHERVPPCAHCAVLSLPPAAVSVWFHVIGTLTIVIGERQGGRGGKAQPQHQPRSGRALHHEGGGTELAVAVQKILTPLCPAPICA